MKVILGPVPCQHCRASVYWGTRMLSDGTLTGHRVWRDVSGGMPHICTKGE